MSTSAAIQVLLHRLQPGSEAEEDEHKPAPSVVTTVVGPTPESPSAQRQIRTGRTSASTQRTTSRGHHSPTNQLDAISFGLTPTELSARKALIFEKHKFVERMVLELSMMHQLPRCCVFLTQFILLLVMVWLSYPSSKILPVHQALSDALTLKFNGTKDTRPEDVNTVDDLNQYLQLLAPAWQAFSPGSSAYMQDPLARKYLDQVADFPPQQPMAPDLQPMLGPSFTITAWIKTNLRYDTLVRKVQTGRSNAICWQFDLERILYGQHETKDPAQVIHPLADTIYQAGVVPEEAWKTSAIRRNISDEKWHHYAVLVGPTTATFVLDGHIQGTRALPRPLTDCANGTMGVGSDTTRGSMVDLKYLPRVLTTVELGFIISRGKLLSDMLAGAGMPTSAETDLQSVLRASSDTQQLTQGLISQLTADLTLKFRRMVMTLTESTSTSESRRLQQSGADDMNHLELEQQPAESDPGAPRSSDGRLPRPSALGVGERLRRGSEEVGGAGGARRAPGPQEERRAAAEDLAGPIDVVDALGGRLTTATAWSRTAPGREGDAEPAAVLDAFPTAAAGRRLAATATVTTTTTTTGAACPDDGACEALSIQAVFDALVKNSMAAIYGAAFIQFFTCLQDHHSHLTLSLLAQGNAWLFPPDHTCDTVAACVDTPYWRDSSGFSCIDYARHNCGPWDDPVTGAYHDLDPGALSNCCVCSRRPACTDLPNWVDAQRRTCGGYTDMNLCGTSAARIPGPDGHTAAVACCSCGGGSKASQTPQNVTARVKINWKLGGSDWTSGREWADSYERNCTWYTSNQVCTPEGDLGPGFYNMSLWYVPGYLTPWVLTDPESALQPTWGATAWTACAGCGGGREVPSSFNAEAARIVADLLPTIQEGRCTDWSNFSALCPYSCGRCAQAPDPQEVALALLGACSDLPYEDWLNQGCSWYLFNDPGTDALGRGCPKYGGPQAQQKCKRSCAMCEYTAPLLAVYDLDHSGKLSLDEMNQLLLVMSNGDESTTVSRMYLPTFVKQLCQGTASCVQANFPEVTFDALMQSSSGLTAQLKALGPGLVADLVEPTGFFGLDSDPTATRFPTPLVLAGEQNLALQVERQSPPVFKACRTDDDCAGLYTAACGNLEAARNKICSRAYQVPMYCASSCRTGGCGSTATVRPRTRGQFCQPCDACFVEATKNCPTWCSGYAVDSHGNFSQSGKASSAASGPSATTLQDVRNASFTLSAWVRNFETQWMFERHVRIPGLNSSWAGYDPSTGMLVCWQMGATKVRFRNRWSDLALTEIANPFASRITNDADQWHHVALWRLSFVDAANVPREDVRFMVDGQMSDPPRTPWGERIWQVPSYGFPDCGGQQLSTTLVSQNTFEGPRDFMKKNSLFPEWNGDFEFDAASLSLPLAAGTFGMTALTFSNVGIPKNATIKLAKLSICAARTMGDFVTEATFGTGANILGTAHLKIAGLSVLPQEIRLPENASKQTCFISELAKGAARSTSEVRWDIDYQNWREKGVPQMAVNSTVASNGVDCQVLSPDLKDIVAEMLGRLDARGATQRDLTFIISDVAKPWGRCGLASVVTDPVGFAQMSGQLDSTADKLRYNNQVITAAMPLWMIPIKDSQRPGATKARLLVQYCLNEECISPSFLGAGPSAVPQASASAAGGATKRRLQDEGAVEAEIPVGVTMILPEPLQDPHAERRRLQRDCGASTCTYVGTTIDAGLTKEGHLYNPQYISRALTITELQSQYYAGLPLLSPDSEDELSGGLEPVDRPNLDMPQYPSEVVSIIPPVMFQQRSPTVPCDQLTPALAKSLTNYFTTQVAGKCNSTYMCADDSGFTCMDRSQSVTDPTFFDTKYLTIQAEPWYPEFLDLFTVPFIYRGGDIVQTSDWLDLQTSQVMVVNVFVTPGLQAGTILIITWSYDGPGRLTSKTELKSFMNMSDGDRKTWASANRIIIAVACLDLLLLVSIVLWRWRHRRRVLAELRHGLQEQARGQQPAELSEKQEDAIVDATPLVLPGDFLDLAIRGIVIAFCVWHSGMYPDPKEVDVGGGETQLLQYYDEPIKAILDLQWADPGKSTEDKVDYFMTQVVDLTERLNKDQRHRLWASILILVCFVRVVAFMRVHPRIAIMYATIEEMTLDFLHFLVLFCTIYGVLAFWGRWSFGDQDPRFGNYWTTLLTQFHMLVGEYGMPDDGFPNWSFGIYYIVFFFLVSALLLNFFLAIVIDSYAKVKDGVKDCEVENSVLWDVITCLAYPLVSTCRGWPGRSSLISGIMAEDFEQDVNMGMQRMDGSVSVDEGMGIPITPALLSKYKLVQGDRRALALMRYYNFVCPAVHYRYEDRKTEVHHKAWFRSLLIIAEVRSEIFAGRYRSFEEQVKDPLVSLKEEMLELKCFQSKELQDIKAALHASLRTGGADREHAPLQLSVVPTQARSSSAPSEELKELLQDVQESLRLQSMSERMTQDTERMSKVEEALQKAVRLFEERDARMLELLLDREAKARERDAKMLELLQQRAASVSPRQAAGGHGQPHRVGLPTPSTSATASPSQGTSPRFSPRLRVRPGATSARGGQPDIYDMQTVGI